MGLVIGLVIGSASVWSIVSLLTSIASFNGGLS